MPGGGVRGQAACSWSASLAAFAFAFAFVAGSAAAPTWAQAPAAAPGPRPAQGAEAPAENQISDLTTRYRFVERYAPESPNGGSAGEIGQYRVANRDVLRVETEKDQGAPDRKETTVQVIYTERPAAVNSSGTVTGMVRRYDAYRVTPPLDTKPSVKPPLQGLSVWVQPRPGATPQILTLTEKHPLTETEFTISTRYLMGMPDLAGVLPALPSRVGDRWAVPRAAAQALLGDRPMQQPRALVAELVDVRRAPDRPEMVAVIKVTGNAKLPPNGSDTALNAQVLFKFAPPAPVLPPGAGAADTPAPPSTVDARGAITDVRLARTSTSAVTGGNGRLRRTLTWELTLQRDLTRPGAPLAVPPRAPAMTPANSWLTYDDPQGRFHLRHPQDMHPKVEAGPDSDGSLQLLDEHAGTLEGRVVTIVLQNKTGDPQKDRDNRDPDFHKKDLNDNWTRNRRDVLHGPSGWLPEADWSPFKMKVYRIEAAEKPSDPSARDVPRIFLDHYLILFTRDESLAVDAITGQDPPLPFRKQVEEILKTFALGPSTGPQG